MTNTVFALVYPDYEICETALNLVNAMAVARAIEAGQPVEYVDGKPQVVPFRKGKPDYAAARTTSWSPIWQIAGTGEYCFLDPLVHGTAAWADFADVYRENSGPDHERREVPTSSLIPSPLI